MKNELWIFITWWKNIICFQAGQDRQLHRNFIPHHESETTQQCQLGQVYISNEIYQRHK